MVARRTKKKASQTQLEFPVDVETKWTTEVIEAAMRARYPAPAFAYLPQVRSRTGYGGEIRTADALVMGLYPSRGLLLEGFEYKASRADWLTELKDHAKADEIFRYCDRWWLVVGDERIVAPGELPPTWGLLAPRRGILCVKVEAPPLTPLPPPREFLAAILRNVADAHAADTQTMLRKADVAPLLRQEFARGEEEALKTHGRELVNLRMLVERFEKNAGVSIQTWQAGHVGLAVRELLAGNLPKHRQDLAAVRRIVNKLQEDLAACGPL